MPFTVSIQLVEGSFVLQREDVKHLIYLISLYSLILRCYVVRLSVTDVCTCLENPA